MKCDKCFFCVKIGKGIYADFPVKYCKYFKTYKLPAGMLIDKLDNAVESGELTEEEARDIYREECADFWRQVNDMYWGG